MSRRREGGKEWGGHGDEGAIRVLFEARRRLGHVILELRLLHGCGVWPSSEKGMDSVKRLNVIKTGDISSNQKQCL